MFDLSTARETMRRLWRAQYRLFAGAAFMVLAMLAIQYDEVIAPGLDRLTGAWSNTAGDLKPRALNATP